MNKYPISNGFSTMWLVVGIAVAGVILLLVVVSGGKLKAPAPVAQQIDTQVESLQKLSTSDEVTTIEAEAESTDLGNLDSEISDIEKDLGGL